ncbi:FAD-dependent oxidoreductase [Halovulum dunhuangense]|uniref:FAD-dependent oxidoreductase n=1 Tax=Halovulum dunhuangense TaxID=1505036 RepID=A0A849L0M9_9RHOB|nr:FAD-dependent oxidoreductase [Halovulum dunhuangense]NNU79828.1 FAD-dependent oxidoreductase [Halovulum dunhuangense]
MGEHIHTDLLVIGAGSGGLSVAAGAVQMGARVVLLEGGRMGGDCLNRGCVPSKALIAAGKHAHAFGTGTPFGVSRAKPRVDFARASAHVRSVIETIAPHDSQERFEALGVRVIREFGRFIAHDTVDAGPWRITARRIVIATGSSPMVPPVPGLEAVPYLTNESVFDLEQRPDNLLVIGGGPIGLELAQAHHRLGARVTVLEAARALGREDPEIAALALARLRDEGIDIREGAKVTAISGEPGAITAQLEGGETVTGSHLLVAVGRKPSIAALDLERAGIAHDRGGVIVDAGLRTSNKRVFAVGDVISGGLQFTHVAGYHAGIVIRRALFGLPARARTDHLPRATYIDPEIAQVGLTEEEARRRHGVHLEVLRAEFAGNDRAQAERLTTGFIKVLAVKGRPVGASIVGAQAGELIQVWSLAIANRLKLSAFANMVAPYPTLGELSKRAAGQYFAPRLFESERVKRIVRFVQRF